MALTALGQIFVDAGGNQLLDSQLEPPLFAVNLEHLRLHRLPDLQHVTGMADALFGANVTDMNHALNAFGNLHEGAKLSDADDRAFHHRANGKLLRRVDPGVAQRLLQSERNTAL